MADRLGVRLPATPPPPSPRRRRTLRHEGSEKNHLRNVPTAENSAKYKGLIEIMPQILSENAHPKDLHTSQRVHAHLPAHVGNTARGASRPAKPGKRMPLLLKTTSTATCSSAMYAGEATRIDLRIQCLPNHVEIV